MDDEEFDTLFGDGVVEVDKGLVETTQDLALLKNIAGELSVKYSHNIGIEKLRLRVLEKLDIVED